MFNEKKLTFVIYDSLLTQKYIRECVFARLLKRFKYTAVYRCSCIFNFKNWLAVKVLTILLQPLSIFCASKIMLLFYKFLYFNCFFVC